MKLAHLLDWRLHALVIAISLISEAIGILKIPLGPGTRQSRRDTGARIVTGDGRPEGLRRREGVTDLGRVAIEPT